MITEGITYLYQDIMNANKTTCANCRIRNKANISKQNPPQTSTRGILWKLVMWSLPKSEIVDELESQVLETICHVSYLIVFK